MTTTTVSIGAGTIAAAAAGAAIAGAVGLGALGIAALGSRGGGGGGRGRKRGGGRKRGHHGGGGRYGRDVTEEADETTLHLERAMELILMQDQSECSLNLVCELSAAEDHEGLTDEQLAILNLVGPSMEPSEEASALGAVGAFRVAKDIGKKFGDCWNAYVRCPLNGTELVQTVMDFLPVKTQE